MATNSEDARAETAKAISQSKTETIDESSFPPFNHEMPLKWTQAPNASWSIGDKIDKTPDGAKWSEGQKSGWTVVAPSLQNAVGTYRLLESGLAPRLVGLVGTKSLDGIDNLAPFSWFNMIAGLPALCILGCSSYPERPRDTAVNIEATNQFTVSIVSEPFAQAANFASVDAPPEISEWRSSGLTMAPSISIAPHRVLESAFSIECELYHKLDTVVPGIGRATNTIFIGLIKQIHVRNDVLLPNGTVDPCLLRPVARLGDVGYARIADFYQIPRPAWKNAEAEVEALNTRGEGHD